MTADRIAAIDYLERMHQAQGSITHYILIFLQYYVMCTLV